MKAAARNTLDILASSMVVALLLLVVRPATAQEASNASPADKSAALSKPAPRLADGHPDLNGAWRGRAPVDPPVGAFPGNAAEQVKDGDKIEVKFGERGGGGDKANIARRKADPNQPPYKPELLAKVHDLEQHESEKDPAFFCKTGGVPRMGAPNMILEVPGQPIVFLYEVLSGNTFRTIPMDGRPHDPDADPSYMGDSVGHWEGDTLVVDTVNFNDDTWLGIDGWFHSTALHVIERISRDGDTLNYQATVEDPNVFTRPWVMNPRTLKPTTDQLIETAPCADRDESHLVNHDHH